MLCKPQQYLPQNHRWLLSHSLLNATHNKPALLWEAWIRMSNICNAGPWDTTLRSKRQTVQIIVSTLAPFLYENYLVTQQFYPEVCAQGNGKYYVHTETRTWKFTAALFMRYGGNTPNVHQRMSEQTKCAICIQENISPQGGMKHTTTCTNLDNTMLSERTPSQTATCSMIPFTPRVQNRQIQIESRLVVGGGGAMGSDC